MEAMHTDLRHSTSPSSLKRTERRAAKLRTSNTPCSLEALHETSKPMASEEHTSQAAA